MVRYCSCPRVMILCCALFVGCAKSGPVTPASSNTTQTDAGVKPSAESSAATKEGSKARSGFWEDYPDVPKVEIMTEVDGIKIPRKPLGKETLELSGPILADVGNEHAKRKSSQPVTGDTLSIRLGSEPKALNSITENSAVATYMLKYYVNDQLARQDGETYEWKPGLAKKWAFEDSIKFSADYPGRERRVAFVEGTPQASLELDYVVPPPVGDKPAESPKIGLKTFDKDGQPAPRTWVGVFPIGRIVGAAPTGYHVWSDENGKLEISGLPTGKYSIRTGDEIFGQAQVQDDGSVIVTAGTAENPLREPVTLKSGEWQDIQAKTYGTFYLREDAKWSDGVAFTSKDIEFAYALLNNDAVDGDSARTYYQDIVECTPLGPHAVRMRYRQQYFLAADFFFQIGYYTPPIHFFEEIFRAQGRELTLDRLTPEQETEKKQISARGKEFGRFFNTDERYNSKPLGNGPYIVDKWEHKDRVELVRNPNHWDSSRTGYLDRIIFKFIPDEVTSLTALKSGDLDFYYDMSPGQYFDDWQTIDQKTQENHVRGSWYIPMYQYVGWNQLATPFKDRRVRLALTMLFDRQEFIDTKMHGEALVISGHPCPFGPDYDHDVAPLAFDPETARELLTEAGWIDTDNDGILDRNGEKFQFLFRMPQGRAIYGQISEVMQRNFKSVGIDMRIQTMEWASFIAELHAKQCDAVMLRWVMDPVSDPFQIWHSSEGAREKRGSNSISFRNPQADELIEQNRVTLDPAKRRRISQSFHRLLDSEQPYSFLWTPKGFGAYHKRYRNVKWYRLRPGFDLAEWYVPIDEQLHK